MFTELCNYHDNLILAHFHHPPKKRCTFPQSLPIPITPTQPQATIDLPSLNLNLDLFICKVGGQGAGWISMSFIECLLSEVMGEKMQDWGSQRAKLCLKSKE